MKSRPLYFSLIVFLAAAFLLNQELFAQDKWSKVQTKNFELIGNADENDIKNVAVKLEQFHQSFRQILSNINFISLPPVKVIVFKDENSFNTFKPINAAGNRIDWIKGYFQRSEDANYIVLSIKSREDETFQTIFHEYVHYLINNNIGLTNVPPWFNEGLAEYYEVFQIENDRKVTLGKTNEDHLRMLQQNNLIPFAEFFKVDYYSLHLQEKKSAGLFYAQAWALMHYLIHQNGDRKNSRLTKFIDLISKSKHPADAFQESFEIDFSGIEDEVKKYIERKNFPVSIEILPNKLNIESDVKASPISEAEAKLILGDLLYQANRLPEAANVLLEVLKLAADSVQANITLGLIRSKQKNHTEARKYIEAAIKSDENNFLPFYQMAFVLSREEMSDFGFVTHFNFELAQKMRGLLKNAIRLNPNHAESYHLYAIVSIVRNEELNQANEYLTKALAIQPGNLWFQIRHAEILWRKDEFQKARDIAQKVLLSAPDEKLKLYAQNTLGIINSLEEQMLSIKLNRERGNNNDLNKIYTEEELAYLRKIGMLKAITASLRHPKPDEMRVLGSLNKIQCSSEGVEFNLSVNDKKLILSSKNFELLKIVSFNPEMANASVGCDSIKRETPAVVIYRPFTKGKTNSAGEIGSIEFVPENFEYTY